MLVGVFDDATARKRAEDEQKTLVSLVENGTDFIGMASLEGDSIFVNRAGRSTVGLRADADLTLLTIDDFMAHIERDRFHKEILPQLWRDGHWEGEVLFRHFQTDRAVPMWHHSFFITDTMGRRIAMGTVGRDLSERKQAEARIEAAQSELAHMARVTTMGELAAAIAHEVNQPLAAIMTNATACIRWLAGANPDLGEARAAASRIATEGKRASDVIDRIRTLVKKGRARVEAVDVNNVVQQVLDLVQSQFRRRGISVCLELASDLPNIQGDPIQLQQVLLNLIVNAIEASAARHDGDREIVVVTERHPPAEVTVRVHDSGVGIDSVAMEQIFKPFYTSKPTGMGMGLSISRTIIEAHGGRLWAEQNQGFGATFRFSIPARQEA
jgi:PAS domain S-box-containing protein